MIRLSPLPFVFAFAAFSPFATAAESPPSARLAELEALPVKTPSDPGYRTAALKSTGEALQLIESNALSTGDEFFRVSKLVAATDNEFRGARVRYELLLAAAVLGHEQAEQQVAARWDSLLHAIGRPVRTDVNKVAERYPEQYQLEAAPASIQAVLRDPAKARADAKSAVLNAEMKQIVDADQADRRSDWSKFTAEESEALHARDNARNVRTREIVAAGELRTAADFANASLVMQHSSRFSGYQLAHELAVCSMLLGDRGRGRWLIAATYDRMLGSIGHDQRFGTQYYGFGSGPSTLGAVDTAGICDAERQVLGCLPLEQAKNRDVDGGASKEQSKLVAEFSGPNGTVRDPKFGLAAKCPEGWVVDSVLRWGDQQNTIHFEIPTQPEPSPSLYYRVYRQPKPMTPEALEAFVREEARKKQVSRRENLPDYTNRPDSFKAFTLGVNPAFSWSADFTSSGGDKWAEYFVRIQTDYADASFFLQAPASTIDKLRPSVDRFMAGLKMPLPGNQ